MKHIKKTPVSVSSELGELNHSSNQNRTLPKLPQNITIHKRPINHAPCASPFAGSEIQKVVYISRKTPVISAVKRVKQFLAQIEKRAMQSAGVDNVLDRKGARGSDDLHRRLDEVSEKLTREKEEVLVKASGRAMEQALRVAEWFRRREDEVLTRVEVRTGSVSVVDDLIEKDTKEDSTLMQQKSVVSEEGETTLEIENELQEQRVNEDTTRNQAEVMMPAQLTKTKRKRKRKQYEADDVPEARIRWVNTVEIAISLRA